MHFVAMLGFTIPGQTIRYNVPVTILSALVAVAVVSVGLLIVAFGRQGNTPLILGGLIIGFGVASMHYIGMAAMRMPDTVRYNNFLVAISVLIAIVAGTAALWAGRIRQLWATVAASLIMGVAVSGMHYTGMAAMRVYPAPQSADMAGGATAGGFLLPLIIGIGSLTFILATAIALSPTEQELRDDAALMARINHGDERPHARRGFGPTG